MTTLRTITIEHLGTDATQADLDLFNQAVAVYIEHIQNKGDRPVEELEAEAIDWVFGDGDFVSRVEALTERALSTDEFRALVNV